MVIKFCLLSLFNCRLTIPIKPSIVGEHVVTSQPIVNGVDTTPVHTQSHAATVNTRNVLILNKTRGLLAVTRDEYVTQSVHQVSVISRSSP